MKRKLIVLVGAMVILGIALTSCEKNKVVKAEKEGFVIGYDIYFVGNTWSVQLWKEFESAVSKNSKVADVIYVESAGDVQRQIANIEDLITNEVDAIITTPNSPTALAPVLNKARAAGIKVILLAATVEGGGYDALVTVNDYDFGKVGAEWLVKQLDGKGNIIMLDGIAGLSVSDDRTRGGMDVFNQYPDIKVVAEDYTNWDYATAKTIVSDMLAANPRIDGVWSQGGAVTQGAIEAFQAAGRPLVPMTSEDNNGFLKQWKALQSSGFHSIACSKPTWLSETALNTAIDLLEGKAVTKDYNMPVPVFSDDELDKYIKPSLSDSLFANTHLSDEELTKIFSN
ncbi:ABC transporter substrate-binding protein [Spirochaetia bacterium]|nr:ABC transporter substrate-binding protein [Spirochaetia bacterium]